MKINLLSTVLVPNFNNCVISVKSLKKDEFLELLARVDRNFCGHPITWGVLKEFAPQLPEAEKGKFWDGEGIGLAARPKGGRRGGKEMQVTIDDLEFCMFAFISNIEVSSWSLPNDEFEMEEKAWGEVNLTFTQRVY